MQTMQTQTPRRKLPGEVMDAATRATLRAHVARIGWRHAVRDLGVSERTIRAALDSRRVRVASIRTIRLALYMAAGPQEPQP
jgi:hypothetical protein